MPHYNMKSEDHFLPILNSPATLPLTSI